MPLFIKVEGTWTQVKRPYVKRNGVWTAVNAAYVKKAGVWKQGYEYDLIPPSPPEITLQIVEDRSGTKLVSRWLRVGARLPGSGHDPDAKLIRVLTNYNGNPPTGHEAQTFTTQPYPSFPNEPWSEWRYGTGFSHADTSVYVYKRWPYNAVNGTIITGDKDYFFGGWTLDHNGNWSIGTQASIHVPKASVDTPNIVIKEANIQANTSGSWRKDGFHSGNLIQQYSPFSTGLWFYGNQFVDSIGAQTTGTEHIRVREAQIYIIREGSDSDTGAANANIYLYWTGYAGVGNLPAAGSSLTRHEITKIGTLAKGQAKWFTLPTSYRDNLNKSIKGLGLFHKDPAKATASPADYSSVVSTATNLRCGEVHIVWEETL